MDYGIDRTYNVVRIGTFSFSLSSFKTSYLQVLIRLEPRLLAYYKIKLDD
jgi:hypothetical protein